MTPIRRPATGSSPGCSAPDAIDGPARPESSRGVLAPSSLTARLIWLIAAAFFATLCPQPAVAAPVRIAVAPAKGPKSARPRSLTFGVAKGLKAAGMRVVAGKRYRRIARKAGVQPNDPRAAIAARAEYLVNIRVRRSKKRKGYRVVVELVDRDGEVTERLRTRYGRGAQKKGMAIGKKLAALIQTERAPLLSQAEAEVDEAPPPPPPPAITENRRPLQPIARRDSQPRIEPPAPVTSGTMVEDNDEPPARIEASASSGSGDGAERSMFRIRVSGGTQLATNYAVSVGGVDTGLQYDLGVVPLVQADLQFALVDVGLGIRGEFAFSPVSYVIDVEPPVDPREPAGMFLGAGGHVFYDIDLATWGEGGRFAIAPLVGGGFSMLSVDSQGPNSVVLGYTAAEVMGGARFIVQLSPNMAIEAEGRGGWLLSFSEDPTTTGPDASGFTIQGGAAVRYWLWSSLGLSLDASYRQMEVSFTGLGNRAIFDGDPALNDASLSTRDIKVALGAVVGF